MGKIKVAVTINENYIYPLKVMLHSLFTSQKEAVMVFCVHARISQSNIMNLKNFCMTYGAEFVEIKMTSSLFENAPVMGYFSIEMYYRLLLPWILPQEDRVLYLDPDMIVNGSLHDLWNCELDGMFLAAARDRIIMLLGSGIEDELPEDAVYMNSGMLLMDLKKMREGYDQEEIQDLLRRKEKKLQFPDQDMLNILWGAQIKQVEDGYNLNPNLLYLKEYLKMPWEEKHSWKIIHYMGSDKPWKENYKGNMYFLWVKSEWQVYPQKRWRILGRLMLEPYRYARGYWLFWKNHDWKKGNKRYHEV